MTKQAFKAGRGYTEEDWNEVCDNPPLTPEAVANARPFAEVFPDLAATIAKPPAKTAAKKLISLRLDQEIIERFKATGPGWQSRMNDVLKEHMP